MFKIAAVLVMSSFLHVDIDSSGDLECEKYVFFAQFFLLSCVEEWHEAVTIPINGVAEATFSSSLQQALFWSLSSALLATAICACFSTKQMIGTVNDGFLASYEARLRKNSFDSVRSSTFMSINLSTVPRDAAWHRTFYTA